MASTVVFIRVVIFPCYPKLTRFFCDSSKVVVTTAVMEKDIKERW